MNQLLLKRLNVSLANLIIIVNAKKQIYISKIDINETPRIIDKDGNELIKTEGHIINLRKMDYYENRVKKGFQ